MQPSNPAPPLRKRRKLTAFTVNIARAVISLFSLGVLIIIMWFGVTIYREHHATYSTINASADASTKAAQTAASATVASKESAERTEKRITLLEQKIAEVKTSVEAIPEKNNKILAEAITAVNTKTETEAILTRKTIASSAEPMQKEISSRLSASEEVIQNMNKDLLTKLAEAKGEAPPPAPPPPAKPAEPVVSSSSVTASFVTNVRNVPTNDPMRDSAVFPQGGASRVFSKKEVERLDVMLAPVSGIHATLIYKNGLFKTWAREVEIPLGGKFDNMAGALQVVFWSNGPFWVMWKKY